MDALSNLRWGLVAALGAVALVRPLLSIAGAYDAMGGGAAGPLAVTAVVAAVWVGVVVATRVPNPLATLAAAGAAYGVLAILLQQVIWNLILGGAPAEAPDSAPVLVVSWVAILVTNTVWGAFLGLVAAGLSRLLPRRGTRTGAGA